MSAWVRRHWVLLLAAGAAALGYNRVASYLAWSRTLREAGFIAEMAPPGRGDRILVVAPHPDDETLGCYGLIRQAVRAGAEVHVVLMTNGDGSELALVFGERELPLGPKAFIDLGRKRRLETLRAMSAAGLDDDRVHFLGFPNNGLLALWRPEHWRYSTPYRSPYTRATFSPYDATFTPEAPYCGQQVLSDLMAVLYRVQPTMILVPAPQDIHPDHWATCSFVRYALATAAQRGARWASETQVHGYLVHWPRYPQPARASTKLTLLPPPPLIEPVAQWQRLWLSPEEARRKLRAIRSYHSQEPGLARLLLRFARANETFELLSEPQMERGMTRLWLCGETRRRGLAGAEVRRLRLTVSPRLGPSTGSGPPHSGRAGPSRAESRGGMGAVLAVAPRRMNHHAYIGLDIRGWDARGAPVIASLSVRAGPDGRASLMGSALREDLPVRVRAPASGRAGRTALLEIPHIPLPPGALARGEFFVTCWASVRDRVTTPAVVGPVRLRAEPQG